MNGKVLVTGFNPRISSVVGLEGLELGIIRPSKASGFSEIRR